MIGNPVLGCGPRRIHFALPHEYKKYESRTDKLEEQSAYDHHFEDQAGSEKSKSTSAATTLGSGKGDCLSMSEHEPQRRHPVSGRKQYPVSSRSGNESCYDSISSSGSESSSSNDSTYRARWDKKHQVASKRNSNIPPEERQAASQWKTPPQPEERQAASKRKTPPEESRMTYASKQNSGKRLDGPGQLRVDNGFGRCTGVALYTPLLIQPAKLSRRTPTPQEVRIITRSKTATAPAPAQKGKGRATGKSARESWQPKERRSRLIKLIIIWFLGINLASYCM
jgi:hypothetical protein